MLDSNIDRGGRHYSLTMEMKVGDNIVAGPSQLGYYKHQSASLTAKVTCHARLTCTHTYNARAWSAH